MLNPFQHLNHIEDRTFVPMVDKVAFIIELVKNFKFVKAKPLSPQKAKIMEGLKEAVDQVNLSKQGLLKLKSARALLDEL